MKIERRDLLRGMLAAAGAAPLACRTPSPRPSAPSLELAEAIAPHAQDEHRDLKGIVVRVRGRVVHEEAFNGDALDTLHDVRSAGKSITSLLMGAAVDRGRIATLTDRVEQYLPEARSRPAGAVPLADLLTMRSGLDADDDDPASPGNEDKLDASAHLLAYALTIPAREPPGRRYVYNSATAFLAGLVVARSMGQTEEDFAREALFAPLGIQRWQWERDGDGNTVGQGNLSLSVRDFAKIGQMVMDEGRHDGRQVLSAAWILESLSPRVRIDSVDPYADGYGFFWYSKVQNIKGSTVPVFFASGNGGNKIYVVPSHEMVVAITSSAYGKGYGQRRSEAILKSILSRLPPPAQRHSPLEERLLRFVDRR